MMMSIAATGLLLSTVISVAAELSATYSAAIQPDQTFVLNVTVTNSGAETVYTATLTPAGMLDTVTPVNLGNLTSGASTSFQLSNSSDPGYLVFSGSGQDALGNPVEFEVVGAGQ